MIFLLLSKFQVGCLGCKFCISCFVLIGNCKENRRTVKRKKTRKLEYSISGERKEGMKKMILKYLYHCYLHYMK